MSIHLRRSFCHPSLNQYSTSATMFNKRSIPKLSRPVQLIVDFDGTLTSKDTMHIVASAGYRRQMRTKDKQQVEPLPPWEYFGKAYMNDFTAHRQSYKMKPQSRTTVKAELEWLGSLEEVEKASARRVEEAGIFDNVMTEDMAVVAREALATGEVDLRDGWLHLLMMVHGANQAFACGQTRGQEPFPAILSVNWSMSFVQNVLREVAQSEVSSANGWTEETLPTIEHILICANEVPSIRNGNISLEMRTSADKVGHLMKMRERIRTQYPDLVTVYIGDSVTDLGCLITADLGICMRDEPLSSGQKDLADTCKRLGINNNDIKKLAKDDLSQRPVVSQNVSTRKLWFATNFEDVQRGLQKALSPD